MNLRKVISKQIRRPGLAADVNALIAANVNESGRKTTASSQQTVAQKTQSKRS
jgi:hypothetical protein